MYTDLKDQDSRIGRVKSGIWGVRVSLFSTCLMVFITSVTPSARLITAHSCVVVWSEWTSDLRSDDVRSAGPVPSRVRAFHLRGHNEVTCCCTQREITANTARAQYALLSPETFFF